MIDCKGEHPFQSSDMYYLDSRGKYEGAPSRERLCEKCGKMLYIVHRRIWDDIWNRYVFGEIYTYELMSTKSFSEENDKVHGVYKVKERREEVRSAVVLYPNLDTIKSAIQVKTEL